jgi:hypothetical protein
MMRALVLIFALALGACATKPAPAPADAFFATVRTLCGKAFEGRLTSTDPADAAFSNNRLVMHVRECNDTVIRVPFHVGEDRSRTWVITRTPAGLRLKHDHRHEDGAPDVLSMYGGDSMEAGDAIVQRFPADDFSKALFTREGRAVSLTNVWSVEVRRGEEFIYALDRPGRSFRVRFDLAKPVPAPPLPWGADRP